MSCKAFQKDETEKISLKFMDYAVLSQISCYFPKYIFSKKNLNWKQQQKFPTCLVMCVVWILKLAVLFLMCSVQFAILRGLCVR